MTQTEQPASVRVAMTSPRTTRTGDGVGVVVVKLGGAALTDKRARGRVDKRGFEDCVETVARAVALGTHRFIVVHGAGGFGHGASTRAASLLLPSFCFFRV